MDLDIHRACSTAAQACITTIGLAFLTAPSQGQTCRGVEVAAASVVCIQEGSAQSFRPCPECPEMVVVPAGSFRMGAAPDEEVSTEREDALQVSIPYRFAVGRYPVTRGEFAAFVMATGYEPKGRCFGMAADRWRAEQDRSWRNPMFPQTDSHPVVCVSWEDANAYVSWLNGRGLPFRLLSEAEREYVARAGSSTAFWWGNDISPERANYDASVSYAGSAKGEARNATVPVDMFAPNRWGLYQVHGNVWDWTADCWNRFNAGNPGDGSARLTGDCTLRVLRGASWNNYPHTLRAARRKSEPLAYQTTTSGFRVGLTLDAK